MKSKTGPPGAAGRAQGESMTRRDLLAGAVMLTAAGAGAGHAYGTRGGRKRVTPSVTKASWGTVDGKQVDIYTLTNAWNSSVRITNYGAMVTDIVVPDRHGKLDDVALGFNTLDEYVAGHP